MVSSVDRAGAMIVYDVRPPTAEAAATPPLVLVGYPMTAEGFTSLAANLPDRTIVTLDPRGNGRSGGNTERADPADHAADLHAVIRAVTDGPVDVFGSSGGAVTLLALAALHPEDLRGAVAHEPPIIGVLPDADLARRASRRVADVYDAEGFGAGMVEFITMTSWHGPFSEAYFAQPRPTPAQFGMPEHDDGSRDNPLLSDRSTGVSGFAPQWEALRRLGARLVIAAGEESRDLLTWRTAAAVAERLGSELAVFPSNHGGFLGGEFGQHGQPEAFADRLREVLASIAPARTA